MAPRGAHSGDSGQAGDRLDEYARKRDFGKTAEPSGERAPKVEGKAKHTDRLPRFVIHEHHARRLHWDLRLEHDGVLLSFALPRGLPWDPKQNHLAVHTEDHPIEYLTFAGTIADGNYGAGYMRVWDTGTYEPSKLEDRKLVLTLQGERAQGRYALFETDGRNWMIHRMDPPEDPDRRHMPDSFTLLQALPGPPPEGDGWAVETHWAGARGLFTSSGGVGEVSSLDGERVTPVFPELRALGRALGITEVALDGVITAPDDPPRVGRRLAARSDSARRRLARDQPVAFVAFDLLWLEGHALTGEPWDRRRQLLDELGLDGPAWRTPSAYVGDPAPIIEAAARTGVDRLVAKRVDAPYEPAGEPPPWRTFAVPPAPDP
jgi:bifunctional non-homologous end joining protein LigD